MGCGQRGSFTAASRRSLDAAHMLANTSRVWEGTFCRYSVDAACQEARGRFWEEQWNKA